MTAVALSFCPHTTLSYLFEKKLVAPQATQNIFSTFNMSGKNATMGAKDATMSAKDATRSAKDATRSAKTRP